jgi:hypothetical protein
MYCIQDAPNTQRSSCISGTVDVVDVIVPENGYGGIRGDLDTMSMASIRTEMRHGAQQRLHGKVPFQGSDWARECAPFTNVREHGSLMRRATLLTGGVIYLPFESVRKAMRLKASDLDRGCVFTDVEIAHNSEGVRMFFEIDYRVRSDGRLPDRETFMAHVRILRSCVFDCFPSLPDTSLDAHVATCDPKVKNGKDMYTDVLAWGAHIVFPNIVLRTNVHKRIAALADSRMSRMFPEWPGIVDPCTYRTNDATLRPLYSNKATPCIICATRVGRKHALTGMGSATGALGASPDECTTAMNNSTQFRLARACDCVRGYRLEPSVYLYNGYMTVDGLFVPPDPSMTTYEKLHTMSIIPSRMGCFMDNVLQAPDDMGDSIDMVPDKSGVVFPLEKCTISRSFARRKDIPLATTNRRRCFQVLSDLMYKLHTAYQHIAIADARYTERTKSVLILVKAKGSRYCTIKGDEHRSNRIYFVMFLGTRARIEQRCFDADCQHPVERTSSVNCPTSTTDIRSKIGYNMQNIYTLSYPDIVRIHDVVDVHIEKPLRPKLAVVEISSHACEKGKLKRIINISTSEESSNENQVDPIMEAKRRKWSQLYIAHGLCNEV